jgi:hypothetical protein
MNRKECSHRIEYTDRFRQSNTLRIEVMEPVSRCLLKLPEQWSQGAKEVGALRWIGSGGNCLVFGLCNSDCPLLRKDDKECT